MLFLALGESSLRVGGRDVWRVEGVHCSILFR